MKKSVNINEATVLNFGGFYLHSIFANADDHLSNLAKNPRQYNYIKQVLQGHSTPS